MPTLHEQLATDPPRPTIVAECVALIDAQVKSKGGLKAVALKAAYGTIKTIKRGFVKSVVEALLDDWIAKLEPYYARWNDGGSGTFADYLVARSEEVSEDLLVVTDERAETTKHTTAKKYYFKMRDKAKDNVVEALPELARLLDAHLQRGADTTTSASA
jgi:hypothetical protein